MHDSAVGELSLKMCMFNVLLHVWGQIVLQEVIIVYISIRCFFFLILPLRHSSSSEIRLFLVIFLVLLIKVLFIAIQIFFEGLLCARPCE